MFARRRNSTERLRWPLLTALLIFVGTPTRSAPIISGAADGKVFHTEPNCPAAKRIAAENRVTFTSIAEAESQGRRACKTCEKLRAKRSQAPPQPTSRSDPPGTARPPDARRPTNPTAPRQPPRADSEKARIRKVGPGCTLTLDTDEKARLMGAICPAGDQPLADEAARAVEKLARGRRVEIEFIRCSDSVLSRDGFGRAVVYVGIDEKRPDLGAELILQGLAWVDRDASFNRRDEYLAREAEAAASNRGIWRRLDGAPGESQVVCGKYARQYHAPACVHRELLIDPVVITLNEARARRLVPCDAFSMSDSRTTGQKGATPNHATAGDSEE